MNKKIFTLLASSLMLFLTAIVMNAQVSGYGSQVQYLPEGQGKGAYHLKVSSIGTANITYAPGAVAPLLSLTPNGMLKLVWSNSLSTFNDLNSTLWCVNISRPEEDGINPVYNFTNKQNQTLLAVDSGRMVTGVPSTDYRGFGFDQVNYPIRLQVLNPKASVLVDSVYTGVGLFSNWAFSKSYNTTPLMADQPLLIQIPGRPGWYLTFASNAGTNFHLVEAYWDDVKPGATSQFAQKYLVRFTIVTAAPRVLTASDFNTTLQTNTSGKTAQLFFTPDVKGDGIVNVFTNKLHAVPSVNNGTLQANNANYYMNFNNNASAVKDLRWIYVADSVNPDNYYNDLGEFYPKIKFDGTRITDPAGKLPDNNDIHQKGYNYEYDFRLVYYPSEDSVIMNVRGIDHIDPYKGNSGNGHAEDPGTLGGAAAYTTPDNLFNRDIYDYLLVRMQDLHSTLDQTVVTIADRPVNTRIHFGNNNCAVNDDRTTVPRDLYVIRDSQNRYLVMPLETGDFTPRWEELRENEDPMKTPSYQWLVYPMNENSPTSPIVLVNREFNWVQIQAAQVYKASHTFSGHVNWLYTTTLVNTDYLINVGAQINYPGKVSTDTYLDIAKKGLKWDLAEGWNGSFLKVQDDQKAAAKKTTGVAMTPEEMQKLHRTGKYLGYKFINADELNYNTYAFNYLHKFSPDYYLGVNKESNPNDTLVYVSQRKNYFRLEITQDLKDYGTEKYGIGWAGEYDASPNTENIAPLERYYYHFMENDYWNFLFDNHYVVIDDNGRYGFTTEYTANTRPREAGVFYLRFTFQPQGQPEYYALIERLKASTVKHYEDVLGLQIVQDLKKLDASHDGQWVVSTTDSLGVMVLGIDQMNLFARTQVKAVGAKTVSTFAVDNSIEPLYRRFNEGVYPGIAGAQADDGGTAGNDDPRTVKIYRSNNEPSVDYLYEDQLGVNASKSCMNCPPFNKVDNGINFLGVENKFDHAAAGPEHAKLGHNYAIYLDTAYVNRGTGTIKPQYLLVLGPQIKEEWYCTDCETVKGNYVYGRYLINAMDSARVKGKIDEDVRDPAYIWNSKWERLAFVPAVHIRDTLFILNGHKIEEFFYLIPGTDEKGLHMKLLRDAAKDPKTKVTAIPLGNNLHKDVVFSMRFIEQGNYQDFLLESETTDRNPVTGRMIAPMNGGWVKIQNNVAVISRGSYVDAAKEAEIWNTEPTTDAPVANDQVAVSAVKVIAGQGNVSILNAAGKQVTISNILGQTVASAVLTSDNATINAPKGVLVVAVQGENAVKAVVK